MVWRHRFARLIVCYLNLSMLLATMMITVGVFQGDVTEFFGFVGSGALLLLINKP